VPRRQPDRACDRQGRLTSSFTHALSYVSVSTRHVVVLEALLLWSTTRVLVFATILCLSIPRASQFSRPVLLQSHILLFANALLDASSRFLPTIPTVLPASMSVVRPVKYDDSWDIRNKARYPTSHLTQSHCQQSITPQRALKGAQLLPCSLSPKRRHFSSTRRLPRRIPPHRRVHPALSNISIPAKHHTTTSRTLTGAIPLHLTPLPSPAFPTARINANKAALLLSYAGLFELAL
jgi:hypothetical protein